jgi:hypothetical protein
VKDFALRLQNRKKLKREIFELRAAANNSTWSLSNFDKEKISFEWRRRKK